MKTLSQSLVRLSMLAPLVLMPVAASAPADAAGPVAKGPGSNYFGRWTVDEDKPVFTARGRMYRTIDVAPCGKDFCGVSVSDKGQCGPVLFRFLGKRAGEDSLRGHGKWGDAKKDVVIYAIDNGDSAPRAFELYLGDGHDFGGRSDNMPKFHSLYRRLGGARCTAR